MPDALDIPTQPAPGAEPASEAGTVPPRTLTLQRLRAEKYVFSARSAAVLGRSNVRSSNALELIGISPTPEPAAPEDGRTPLNRYAEKFARYSLLFIVVFTGVVFFNMVKVFFVPVILAAVFAGLFHPFYEWLVKLARGRRAVSAFVSYLALSLGVLLPAYGVANLVARETVRFYQAAEAKGLRTLEADSQSFVQRYPMLQTLRLEALPLHATAERPNRR